MRLKKIIDRGYCFDVIFSELDKREMFDNKSGEFMVQY